jgi:plastocyanin
VLAVGCSDREPETPPPEPAPTEGVYGQAPAAVGGVPSVIILETGAPTQVVPDRHPVMDQLGLQFSPRHLVASVGAAVTFTNSESIAHNVTVSSVASDSTVLDADTPPSGSVDFVFEAEGGYDVTCGTHPGMTAFIYATESPYAVFAEADGTFHVSGVPSGEYTLRVWSLEEGARSERTVEVRQGAATEVSMTPLG